ncbi:MAG: S9 family peptidase [Proteobacteria bacterium]|nr:S9 family peptidase [Pseudomonadota bacterium]
MAALISSSFVLGCQLGPGRKVLDSTARESAQHRDSLAQLFLGNPVLNHIALSPDGRRVAGVLAKDGVELLIVQDVADDQLRVLSKLERSSDHNSWTVRKVLWPSDDRLLVSVEMPSTAAYGVRARQTRLVSLRLGGGKAKYLGAKWPDRERTQFQDQIISTLPDDPDGVLIGLRMIGERGVGVRRLNVENGVLSTVVRPLLGAGRWFADHDYVVRAAIGWAKTGTDEFLYARESGEDDFEKLLRWNRFDREQDGFWFAGFSADPSVIYVYRYTTDQGRLGVHRYGLRSRKLLDLVFADPEYDVRELIHSSEDGRLVAIAIDREKPEKYFVDQQAADEERHLEKLLPGLTRRVVSSDREGKTLIIRTSSDRSPPYYFIYERESGRVRPLFSAYPGLEKIELAAMAPVQFESRDGLTIAGYSTRPHIGEAPYPTIVLAHGGPASRYRWGGNPEVQYLANLGFAVFQPNFRGSNGYGREFETMSYGEWGQAMQNDITDGTRWLIAQRIADPNRIGIYGSSYGGYAALWGLIKTPDLFRAGASYAAVTDLSRLLGRQQYYRGAAVMEHLVGERWGDRAKLRGSSPARNAEKIRVPVLLGHGTEDPTVHVEQLEAMAEALRKAGNAAETYVYAGEYHGFLDERNRIDFYEKLGEFFQRHLGVDTPSSSQAAEVAGGS